MKRREFLSLIKMPLYSDKQVKGILAQAGLHPVEMMDARYICPKESWFKKAVFKLSSQLGAFKKQSNDCDNFALATMALLRLMNSRSTEGVELAVGYFSFITRTGDYHAINFAIVEDEKIVFIEPQSGQIYDLTVKEVLSCRSCLI